MFKKTAFFSLALLLLNSLGISPAQAHGDPNDPTPDIIDVTVQCIQNPVYDSSNRLIAWDVSAIGQIEQSHQSETIRVRISVGSYINEQAGIGNITINYRYENSILPAWNAEASSFQSAGHAGSYSTCDQSGGGQEQTPACPDPSTTFVFLTKSVINVGETSTAVAPNGWSGGTFISSNSSVASIGTRVDQRSYRVNGIGAGTATIRGIGWTTVDGATGCDLGGTFISVNSTPPPPPSNPPTVTLTATSPVQDGQTSLLTWTSQNTDSCIATAGPGFSTGGATNGNDQSSPLSSSGSPYTFTISCTGPGGTTQQSAQVTVTGNNNPPTVTLTATSPVQDGQTSLLTWTSQNADSCIATAGPGFSTGGATNGNDQSSPLSSSGSPYTFTISCTGPGGTTQQSAQVLVTNDNVATCPDPSTTFVFLTKSVINVGETSAAVAPNGWSGGTFTSSNTSVASIGSQIDPRSYRINGNNGGTSTIKGMGWTTVDGATGCELGGTFITVNGTPPPPPPPNGNPEAHIYNTATVPPDLGVTVTCGRLLAVWSGIADPAQIDGYRIYNESTGKYIELKNPNQTRYEFDPGDLGSTSPDKAYLYSVSAFKGNSETSRVKADTIAPTTNCGSVDFGPSNKDIVQVRNIPLQYDPKNLQSDHNFTSDSLPIRDNDKIVFAINIVNGGTASTSESITVVDTMYNLYIPNKKVEARVECNDECRLARADYDENNKQITFVVSPIAGQSLDQGEVWTVFFSANTIAPKGVSGSVYRFQNTANLPSIVIKTPYIPVIRDDGIPTIFEIQ